LECGLAACGCCGADLADADVIGVQERQPNWAFMVTLRTSILS